jgi:hypothetical protein
MEGLDKNALSTMIPYIARETLLGELFPVGCGVSWCLRRNRKKKMEES